MYFLTKCYGPHNNLIAIIQNEAIYDMTCHTYGLCIYTKQYYSEYDCDVVECGRKYRIICEYTIGERIKSIDVYNYIKSTSNVPFIELDLSVYDSIPYTEDIGEHFEVKN